MSIRLECSCGKKLSIKDEMAGRRVKCPACDVVLTVPTIPTKAKLAEEDGGNERTDTNYFDKPLPPRTGRSRARLTSASRPSGRAQGRSKANAKSGGNRTTLIAFSAGIGVLAIGLAGWMLWPAGPDADSGNAANGTETANSSVANATTSSSPQQQTATSASNAPTVGNGSQNATTVGMTPAVTVAPELNDDLKLLQGTWQVTDFKTDANQPTPPEALSTMKQTTCTFDGGFLLLRGSGRVAAFSVLIDSTKSIKGIELTRLSNVISNMPVNQSWIYNISNDTLNVCMSKPGANPPTELVANAALGHAVLTLSRMRETMSESPRFDYAAWIKASERLKELKVRAVLMSGKDVNDVNSDIEQVVHAGSIELVDGLISAEIWNVLLSQSFVVVRFTEQAVLTDATLQQLSQHPGLVGFGLDGPHSMTATGVMYLKNCPVLSSLTYYSKTPITPEVLRSFTELEAMQALAIRGQRFSQEMIASIVRVKKLKSLIILESEITDDVLMQLATLTSLEGMNLQDSPITDKGLESLKNLKALNFLGLSGTKVSDIGLQSLKALPSLKILYLERTSITPQALAEFQAAVPGCRVVK